MVQPVLNTARMVLRPMTLEHLPLLHVLDSDPEVMRFLLGRARTPEEIDEFWAPRCRHRALADRGLGWWVGFADDVFLGWWELGGSDSEPFAAPVAGRAEIGWRVARSHWRRGFATEGGQALLRHAFETLGLDAVYAETMAVNEGSRGVMRKLGMRHVRTYDPHWDKPLPGSEQGEVVYEIRRERLPPAALSRVD